MATTTSTTQITSHIVSPNVLFAETIIGHKIFVNPACKDQQNTWDDINWDNSNASHYVEHDKHKQCFFATGPLVTRDGGYVCTAVFINDGGIIYDICPDVIMNQNEWYRNSILTLSATNTIARLYLIYWMSKKCGQVSKYKKKMKRLKRNKLNEMVEQLMKQYGAYLGYNIWGTLNRIGLRKQQKKLVKMPLLLFRKTNLFKSFVSKNSLYYCKNKTHTFNVNNDNLLHQWLIQKYIFRQNTLGLWSIVQNQVSYNEKTQVLMIKYDVMWKDMARMLHFTFRDLNCDNPNYLKYKDIQKLVFGYIRTHSTTSIPVVLCKLCLEYRYVEDGDCAN